MPRTSRAHSACDLEHLVMEEEEARKPELVDERQLVLEAGSRIAL